MLFKSLGVRAPVSYELSQRVPGTVMEDTSCTSPNHNSNSEYRNPTYYYRGTLDALIMSLHLRPLLKNKPL